MGSIDQSATGTLDKASDTATFTDVTFAEDGTLIHDLQSVSSDTTTDGTGYWLVDSSSAVVTMTLATADAVDGQEINIKRNGSNNVNINTEGSATIDGVSSTPQYTLDVDDESVTVVYNATDDNWETY